MDNNVLTKSIKMLGEERKESKALNYGIYRELLLTNRQYAYARTLNPDSMYYDGKPEEERIYDNVVITLNNDDNPACLNVPSDGFGKYKGVLSGSEINADNGRLNVNLEANSGEVWLPVRWYYLVVT